MIIPSIFQGFRLTAFFTDKKTGADRSALAEISGLPAEQIYLPVQKHTDTVLALEDNFEPVTADAIVTGKKNILIGVRVADCVPVLVFDKAQGITAAVHAGWRGTAAGILVKTIKVMTGSFSCRPEDILIAIGPSIRGCCYGVGIDVHNAVADATGDPHTFSTFRGEKYFLDLALANRSQAVSIGVPEQNIWAADDCTFCNPSVYFSYRYDNRCAGRQGAFIGIIDR